MRPAGTSRQAQACFDPQRPKFELDSEQFPAVRVSGHCRSEAPKNAYDVGNFDRSCRSADYIDSRRL